MSFLKGERNLELCTNYNPPPNYYQHQHKIEEDADEIHATFAKQQRFRNQQKNKNMPGPGHYYKPGRPSSKGYKMIPPKSMYATDSEIKINSIPSIPKQSTARAYEELAPGILVLHEAELEEGDIGPGSYDPVPVIKKGVTHKFSTAPYDRFQTNTKQVEEPKVYVKKPEHPKINLKEKLKHPEKKIMNPSDLCLELIILRQKQMKLEQVPPPGYYHNDKATSGFVFQQKPKQLQFLAGRAKRFEELKKQDVVGPGQYELVSINKLAEGGSISKAVRNTDFGMEARMNPGPGAYVEEVKQHVEVSKSKHPPIFASGCIRFAKQGKDETPGPGQYNVSKSKKVRRTRMIKVQSLTNKTSDQFNAKQKFTSGDLNYFSNDSYHKKRGYTTTHYNRKQSSSFASKIQRFKEAEKSIVGPGFYELNSKTRTKFNRKQNILERQQRFKYQSTNFNEVGPGHYDINDQSIKPKRAHDVIFK